MKRNKIIFYYIILSIIASIFFLILTFLSPLHTNVIVIYDKLFIGGAFITSCIFGISLAVYPQWLKKLTKHTTSHLDDIKYKKKIRRYYGHHPDCGNFKNHIIEIKNKTFCAGCLGLSIGSMISIILMSIYVIAVKEESTIEFYYLIFFGLIIIGFIYVEIILTIRNAIIHVISNIFLVLSFFIVTISIFEITGNKVYGIISVIISFLFLSTRIQLSNWQHTRICERCNETCKVY